MLVKVIYKGRLRTIPKQEAKVLLALGLASSADEREAEQVVEQAATVIEAPEVEISPRTGKPKRRYQRRDLTSE